MAGPQGVWCLECADGFPCKCKTWRTPQLLAKGLLCLPLQHPMATACLGQKSKKPSFVVAMHLPGYSLFEVGGYILWLVWRSGCLISLCVPGGGQATSYLVTAWEALAAQRETTMEELPVVFEDVSIVQAVQANPGDQVTLSVLLDRSHRFQVRMRARAEGMGTSYSTCLLGAQSMRQISGKR